jgi:hypothetical protein
MADEVEDSPTAAERTELNIDRLGDVLRQLERIHRLWSLACDEDMEAATGAMYARMRLLLAEASEALDNLT